MNSPSVPKRRRPGNDPWQILAVALLFFVPGVGLLCSSGPALVFHRTYRHAPNSVEMISESHVHVYGILALLASGATCLFYRWLRREIQRDEELSSSQHQR